MLSNVTALYVAPETLRVLCTAVSLCSPLMLSVRLQSAQLPSNVHKRKIVRSSTCEGSFICSYTTDRPVICSGVGGVRKLFILLIFLKTEREM